jgi:hypothetical protein
LACDTKKDELVEFLWNKVKNINEEDPKSLTLLMKYAVLYSNKDFTQKLIRMGADINH